MSYFEGVSSAEHGWDRIAPGEDKSGNWRFLKAINGDVEIASCSTYGDTTASLQSGDVVKNSDNIPGHFSQVAVAGGSAGTLLAIRAGEQ